MTWEQAISLNKGVLISTIVRDGKTLTAFATTRRESLLFDENWGKTEGPLLVKVSSFEQILIGSVIDKSNLLPGPDINLAEVVITTELNGTLANFGFNFWEQIRQQAPSILAGYAQKTVHSLTYSDRYLASPLTVILFAQLVEAMPFTAATDCPVVLHVLASQPIKEQYINRRTNANWYPQEDAYRQEFTEKIFDVMAMDCTINMYTKPKEISHSRNLKLVFNDGSQLVLRLDQGVGYWQNDPYPQPPVFPFTAPIIDQLNWVKTNLHLCRIRNGQSEPTYVFVKKV